MPIGRCLIDTSRSDQDIIDQFRSLHEDFQKFADEFQCPPGIELPMLIKYMVFAYDRNSHIAIDYKAQYIIKKKQSAIRAKFPTLSDNGATKFTKEAENIIFNKNEEFGRIIIRYLSLQFSNDWQIYIVYNEMLVNVLQELMAFKYDKPSDLAKAKDNERTIREDIAKMEYRMFSGEEMMELKTILYAEAYKASLELRPEFLATKRENGEKVVDINPYGENYEVDQLKFVDDK
jgi:hypothetical protein